MINIQLIPSQHAHFDTFGFLILRQLSSAVEIERYNREFDAGHRAWLGEQSYDGKSRHYTTLMEEYSLFIASLADDGRFVDVAEQLLGKDVVCIVVGANYMVGNTGWHPDTASLDYAAVKFCIYPDPLTATTSALRVLPGSHREPLHSAIERDIEQVYGISSAALPATACESEPSDVVVFNVGTWHVAFGGALGRWQGVLVYYEDPPIHLRLSRPSWTRCAAIMSFSRVRGSRYMDSTGAHQKMRRTNAGSRAWPNWMYWRHL